jgi:hypothetical protein
MEAEAALVQIRALANSFLTPELRHQLKLPAGSADPGGNNRQPDDLAHENQQLRQQLAELVEENALGKRRRLVGEVNVVEGGSSAGRSLTSWGQGGERRRAAEEVEASRVVHAREREAWQKERAQLEASRDTFARDLKFVALRLESREHELTEAKAEHQHRVKSLETQLREAQREGFAGAQQHIAEEASAGSLARQVEKLTSDKASLERALASLEASTQSALAKASATHADELAAERALREEQAQNQATAREFKAEAATKAAELKVAQLQKELAAEQHRAQALAQQVANAPAVPSKALEETNDALTAQVASLRAELVEEQSKAATATNERDLLNDQSQAWVALFNQEGGNLLAPNEELTGNGAHAKADPASSLSRHKTSKATPSASSLPQRVFEALRVARANELAYRSLHAKSEDKRREQTLQLETASQEVAEWKATAARVERVKSGLEADLATSRHLLGVKDQALTRRNELLASYAHNEAKPGRRSDDQKFEKERLLESEVASLQKALRNHEEAMARASGGGGGGGGGGGQPQNPHVEAAEAAVASLEAQLKAALAEKTETERNLERCEETLRVANSTGQVVSQQAKVLHMVANPSAAAAAQRRQAEAARVSGLEEENERLKVALAAAQQGGKIVVGEHAQNA